MFATIRAKLGTVFVSFLLLVVGSVIATSATIRAQATDALVINLAGRQRMLTQEMTKAVLGIARDSLSDYDTELHEAALLFDHALAALLDGGPVRYGGETVTLPPTTSGAIRAQLGQVAELWDRFREDVETVQAAEPEGAAFGQAVRDIESLSPVILSEMDLAVRLYEAAAVTKLTRLRTIQSLFFISAVCLLVAGYFLTQRTIVDPLSKLKQATVRIASGDLQSSIDTAHLAVSEVHALAQSFEGMRHELDISRQKLERWAAELEARVEQRTQQLAALFEIGADISSKLEIERVLESVVEKTRSLAGGEVAILCLLDPSGESLIVTAISGVAEAFVGDPRAAIGSFSVPACTMDAAIIHKSCDCPLLHPQFRSSHLAVSLCIGERTHGMLCVGHRQANRFGEEETRLLSLLATTGMIALENARSYERAEQTAALAERERILAEIHDGLAQTLSFLGLRLDVVQGLIEDEDLAEVPEHLALTRHTVEQAGREARRLMAGLRAGVDTPRTLQEILTEAVDRFGQEREIEVEMRVETEESIRGSPQIYEQAVRVVLEALTNVYKHASDSHPSVTICREGRRAIVRIQDDGPGFDADLPIDGQQHFGLKVMQTRAEWIGGELDIQSAPGHGTTVALSWPLPQR